MLLTLTLSVCICVHPWLIGLCPSCKNTETIENGKSKVLSVNSVASVAKAFDVDFICVYLCSSVVNRPLTFPHVEILALDIQSRRRHPARH